MRMLEQSYRGSMTSRVQRVRTGVLLVMIRTVRMMTGAGVWQVLDEMVTGGAPRAQVGTALTTLPQKLCCYCFWIRSVHLDEAQVHHEDKNGCTNLTIFFHFTQMGLGQQGGTQISDVVSHSMQEKTSVATGDHDQAVAAWRMRGTACLNGAWRTQTRRRGPSTHQGPFSHSR